MSNQVMEKRCLTCWGKFNGEQAIINLTQTFSIRCAFLWYDHSNPE